MPPASAKSIAVAKTKLLQSFADLYCFGKHTTFNVKTVATSAGYSCITGKAVRAALQELKADGIVERSKDEITLTRDGVNALPAADEANLPTDDKAQEKLLEMILKKEATCTPMTNETKTKAVLDLMLDGKVHTKDAMLEAAEYARHDTKQFRNLIKRMKMIGALEEGTTEKGDKGFQLGDSAWPVAGRPGTATNSGSGEMGSSETKRKAGEIGGEKKKAKKDLAKHITL